MTLPPETVLTASLAVVATCGVISGAYHAFQRARLLKRVVRAEGAMLRMFALVRNAEPTPAGRDDTFQAMRDVTNDWFDEAMLGQPPRLRKSASGRQTTFVDEGVMFDEAQRERDG